jgi:hypothetical protein
MKTILVPIEPSRLMNSTLETALLLAQKFNSYVEGIALLIQFIQSNISIPIEPLGPTCEQLIQYFQVHDILAEPLTVSPNCLSEEFLNHVNQL